MGGIQKTKASPDDTGLNTIFLTGYARLPAGITASELYRVVGIGIEVDAVTSEIVSADCTLATEVGRNFFSRLVVGKRLDEEFDKIVEEIERRYQGNAQKALITALRISREKYKAYKEAKA
ncbi:MAG TPA: DUF3870 domain-containing protein [Clostridia bacterium]|nr:DUF3870 domain-containing protein [Clostridia bacterium]